MTTFRGSLRWAPRVLAVALAFFFALFALDAFQHGRSLWQNLAAFAIHLVPALVVLLVLLLAERWPRTGGAIFAFLGFAYFARVGLRFGPWAIVAISGPLLLLGILFFLRGTLVDR